MSFSSRFLYPIAGILMIYVFTGCGASYNFSNYQTSPPSPKLKQAIAVQLNTQSSVNKSDLLRFKINISPPIDEGFRNITQQELINRGFEMSSEGIPLKFTLTELVWGSGGVSTFVRIRVDGIDADGNTQFSKYYKTYTSGKNSPLNKKVTSIWSEDPLWKGVQLTYKQVFNDPEFWAFVERGGVENTQEDSTENILAVEDSESNTAANSSTSKKDAISTMLTKQDNGFNLTVDKEDYNSEQIRDAWMKRGGNIQSNAYGVGMTITNFSNDIVTSTGVGGNVNGDFALISLKPPKYENGVLSGFKAFKVGANVDIGYVNISSDVNISGSTQSFESSQTQLTLGGELGMMFGAGGGTTPTSWRGVVLGLSWKPSYQYIQPEEGDAIDATNLSGFSIDFDFAKLNTSLTEYAPEPQNRLSIFFLPPVKENMPFILSISWKRVIY